MLIFQKIHNVRLVCNGNVCANVKRVLVHGTMVCYFTCAILFQFGMSHIQTVRMYPFMLHTISMSLFASIIGPFGGFFASGFKRAFNIKVRL